MRKNELDERIKSYDFRLSKLDKQMADILEKVLYADEKSKEIEKISLKLETLERIIKCDVVSNDEAEPYDYKEKVSEDVYKYTDKKVTEVKNELYLYTNEQMDKLKTNENKIETDILSKIKNTNDEIYKYINEQLSELKEHVESEDSDLANRLKKLSDELYAYIVSFGIIKMKEELEQLKKVVENMEAEQ